MFVSIQLSLESPRQPRSHKLVRVPPRAGDTFSPRVSARRACRRARASGSSAPRRAPPLGVGRGRAFQEKTTSPFGTDARVRRPRATPRRPSRHLAVARALRAAEGDDIAPAAALVAALEPGSGAARSRWTSCGARRGVRGRRCGWRLAARNGAPARSSSRARWSIRARTPRFRARRVSPGTRPRLCGGRRRRWRRHGGRGGSGAAHRRRRRRRRRGGHVRRGRGPAAVVGRGGGAERRRRTDWRWPRCCYPRTLTPTSGEATGPPRWA